jgi:hypothetical protein
MRLQEQLDSFKAEFARTAPVGRPALFPARNFSRFNNSWRRPS